MRSKLLLGSQFAKTPMHVITRKTLKQASHLHRELVLPLEGWFRVTKKANWDSFADVRRLWSSADIFGTCTIFNLKGNKYRLVVWIDYRCKRVFIRHVMTHAEYSKEAWKSDCSGD